VAGRPQRWKPAKWNTEHSDFLAMDTLRAMRAFLRTIALGSLSAAARSLNTTQPTVSKLLTDLERQAGVQLLERSSTRIQTTAEGAHFLETARRVVEDYDDVLVELQGLRADPKGVVRLAAPVALGQCWLNPLVPAFLERNPRIELEVMLEDRFVDLVEERIDVALRIGGDLPPNLVAKQVGRWPRQLVASPGYLKRHGKLRQPSELSDHNYLQYAGGAGGEIELSGSKRTVRVAVKSRYRINSAVALLSSVDAGLGVALQPSWLVASRIEEGRLVHVLPQWSGPCQVAHVLFHPRRRQAARVAVLLEFLLVELGKLTTPRRPA
jgi:DNA-binding transcriptional LysR family regulator